MEVGSLQIVLFEDIISTKTGVYLRWMKLYNACKKKETGRIALQWVCIYKGPDMVGHKPRCILTLCLACDQLCRSISAYETKIVKICGKTFADKVKSTNITKIFPLKSFVAYGIGNMTSVHSITVLL